MIGKGLIVLAIESFSLPIVMLIFTVIFVSTKTEGAAEGLGAAIGGSIVTLFAVVVGFFLGVIFLIVGYFTLKSSSSETQSTPKKSLDAEYGSKSVTPAKSTTQPSEEFTKGTFFWLVILGSLLWIVMPIITLYKWVNHSKHTRIYVAATILSFFLMLFWAIIL
ncbi:MAG: hypothetical protein V1921_06980 [Candidatus Altiarchaeota archaeon]